MIGVSAGAPAGLAPPIPLAARSGPDAPTGRDRFPVAKLYAVYLFGWRDRTDLTTPLGDDRAAPALSLIGLCRERAKADRIAARIRRSGRQAVENGAREREPVIGRAPYDPFRFLTVADRDRVSRVEAHRLAVAGVVARRAELGIG